MAASPKGSNNLVWGLVDENGRLKSMELADRFSLKFSPEEEAADRNRTDELLLDFINAIDRDMQAMYSLSIGG